MSLPKPHPLVSNPPLSDLEQRIKLVNTKLDEQKIKGGIRLPASDDNIAAFSSDNNRKLLSKHPLLQIQIAYIVFFVKDFDLDKAIRSFPNRPAAGPDKKIPQIFKNIVS